MSITKAGSRTQLEFYKYTDLMPTNDSTCNIRLLRIVSIDPVGRPICTLRQGNTLATYTALSYRWGSATSGRKINLRAILLEDEFNAVAKPMPLLNQC